MGYVSDGSKVSPALLWSRAGVGAIRQDRPDAGPPALETPRIGLSSKSCQGPDCWYRAGQQILSMLIDLSSPALRLLPAMLSTIAKGRKKKPEIDDKTLGKRLHDLRVRQGMTQTQLASKVGLKQPMLSLYERGDVRLPAILAARLVQALGASCDELVGLKESRESAQLQDRAIARRLQKLERLSRRDKQTLLRTIDRFLQGSGAS